MIRWFVERYKACNVVWFWFRMTHATKKRGNSSKSRAGVSGELLPEALDATGSGPPGLLELPPGILALSRIENKDIF